MTLHRMDEDGRNINCNLKKKFSHKSKISGKEVGNIGIDFDGNTDEERNKQIEEFITTCLRDCCYTAVDYDSMIAKGLVLVEGNGDLICTKCNHTTTRKDHMKQHLAHHYKDFRFKCKFCSKTCTTQSHFKVHLRKHTGIPSHHCDQCSFATFTSTSLQSHINHMHCNVIRFKCPACNNHFDNSKDMQKHTKECVYVLKGKMSSVAKCHISDMCGFECISQQEMLAHVKDVHSSEGFCCSHCPVVLKDEVDLAQHTTLHKSYHCTKCRYRTDFKTKYIKHFLTNHSLSDFSCYFCGEKSFSKAELDKHEQLHVTPVQSKATKYQCLKCDYTTTKSKILLKKHCRRMHSLISQLSCDKCAYKCSEVAQLNLHMRKHTDTQSYLCHDCGFSCKWPSQMRLHRIKHTGKKPYKCEHCSYEAFRSDSITNHMMHKHKSSVFMLCEKCGRSLPTETAFKKHMKAHDMKEKQQQMSTKVEIPAKPSFEEKPPLVEEPQISSTQFPLPSSNVVSNSTSDPSSPIDNTGTVLNDVVSTNVNRTANCQTTTGESPAQQLATSGGFAQRTKTDIAAQSANQSDENSNIVDCFFCAYQAKSTNALYQHMCASHRCRTYQCAVCPYKTSALSKYLIHRMEHLGVNPAVCNMGDCNYKACTQHHLRLHVRKHDAVGSGKKLLRCKSCSYTTKWRNLLKLHQQRVHTRKRSHYCRYCDYACYRADVLKSHVIRRHSDARPHKCSLCPYSAKEMRSLQKHMARHNTERSHTCTTCGKSFKSRPVLLHHERSHSRTFDNRCDFCKFRCNDLARFRDHVARHVKEYAMQPFRCPHCPYGAGKRKTLAAHKRRRHGGRSALSKVNSPPAAQLSSGDRKDKEDSTYHNHNVVQGPSVSNYQQPSATASSAPPAHHNAPLTYADTEPLYSLAAAPFYTNMLLSDDVETQPLPSSALLLPGSARAFLSNTAVNSTVGNRSEFGEELFSNVNGVDHSVFKR